jgi:acyl-CoA synthetase (NDP forming)
VLRSIVGGGFTGDLFVVHPTRHSVGDVVACPTFAELPVTVDLAVIAVPAEAAEAALADAARAGVPAAVVISSGFGELGPRGAELQSRLARLARTEGIRLVGPNCLGLLANDPATRLNATFHAQRPPGPGGLAIASQSGGVGIVLLDRASQLGLGVRSFVSLGNAADVSSNDLLAAWYDDPEVTAAALYLESFGNARKFARFARTFSERKPLLAVVGGSSASGRRGGASHTAAAASSAVAVHALFAQAGVVACSDADDLAETALLFTEQPLPAGPRVGVISNAGGMGILAADAAEAAGLQVPELSPTVRECLGNYVLGTAGTTNPVDAGAAVSPEDMGQVLDAVLASGEVDCAIAVVVATGVTDGVAIVDRLAHVRAGHPELPVVLVTLGGLDIHDVPGVTRFGSTTAAVRALGHAVGYARWRAVPAASPPVTDAAVARSSREAARAMLAEAGDEDGWVGVQEARELLASYGLRVRGDVVVGVDAAVAAADRLGYPVAVKLARAGAQHKTEAGLVHTELSSADAVRQAVDAIGRATAGTPVVLVQPMERGVELALGMVRDPTMGPLVMVAAGGVATDVWDDRVFLLPPVTMADAGRALRGLRLWPLLTGFRGAPRGDVAALEQHVVDLARLATEVTEVAELDLNPVIVAPEGCWLVDVRLRLAVADDVGGSARQLRRVP